MNLTATDLKDLKIMVQKPMEAGQFALNIKLFSSANWNYWTFCGGKNREIASHCKVQKIKFTLTDISKADAVWVESFVWSSTWEKKLNGNIIAKNTYSVSLLFEV